MPAPRSADSRRAVLAWSLVLCATALLAAFSLFRHLSYPLLWHDESETAMFARRVLEYGYPKVHGEKNVVFSLWQRDGTGIAESLDAYTGSPWAQYYVGAIGVAAADATDDLYAKTLRVRLPFAAAGALGLAILALAVLPSLSGRGRRLAFGAAFALVVATSVSLQLHVREARYYGLVVLLVALILSVHLRRTAFGTLPRGRATALLSALLVALFLTFHPALAAVGLAIGVDVAWRAWRDPAPRGGRLRAAAGEALPLLLAAVAIAPLLAFFDFAQQTRGWIERFSDAGTALRNAGFVAASLLRQEWLAPALVLRGAVLALGRSLEGLEEARRRARVAAFLLVFAAAHVAVVAQIPFLFERYFVVVGPVVATAGLLDAFTLADLLRSGATPVRARRVALAAAALAGIALLGTLALRLPALAGRLEELRRPYRGPLDFAIPYLRERYVDIEDRVIATNYEGPAYMFYLGSQVTVGFYGNALERDLAITPDVIVPRPWPDQLEVLRALSERETYVPTALPVANLLWNNNPALSPRPGRATAHHFATPRPVGGRPALVLLERPPGAGD